jgi:hypothetical protein
MTTTRDNRNIDNDDVTTTELTADVVAPVVTPPPPPLTAPTTTPCGPSTSTPGPAPFRSELVSGERGGGSTSSSLSHRPCCPTLSSTVSLRSRPTRLLCRPWCIYLRRCGHRGRPSAPSPMVFLHSMPPQPSRRPCYLHHRHRGHRGCALGASRRWLTLSTP